MSDQKHLKLHHDTWVFSRRVPKSLKHLYPSKTHINKSLGTSSIKLARIKRDRLNGEIAVQAQGAYSGDRISFKAYVEQIKPHADILRFTDQVAVTYDDVLPRNEIAKAAFRQEIYGETLHAYTYTFKEGLSSLISRNTSFNEESKKKLLNTSERFLMFIKASDVPLREIHKKQVVQFVEYLGQDYAHGTIVAHLSRLRSVWTHAYKLGEVESKTSPFCDHDLSQFKGERSKKKQLFNSNQLKYIINNCPSEIMALSHIALFTGARCGEICNAHEEVVEDIRCMVIKKGKTESAARIVPLSKHLNHIKLPIALTTKQAGRLFSNFKVKEVTDDRSRSLHSLRAHFATAAQRAQVEEFDTAALLGHKTGFSMSYGHYARQDVKRLAKAIDLITKQIDAEWLS